MKRAILIVNLIFSLLFININGCNYLFKNSSFVNLSKNIMTQYPFVENGVKLEYYTDNLEEKEIEKINNIISKKIKVRINKNIITAKEKQIEYLISVFNINGKTKVDIEITNTNSKINIDYLVNKAKEIMSNNADSRIFKYLKVKCDIDSGFSNSAKENIKLDTNRSLLINNGIVSNAIMKDGNRLNIAKVNYNTGSYLIIGTPTIFVTY